MLGNTIYFSNIIILNTHSEPAS